MLTRRALSGLVALSAAAVAAPATAQAAARAEEARALRGFAEKTHPRGREAAADPIWRANWDALAAQAGALSDGAYVAGLMHGLAWFADGHTTVLPFEFTGGVPAPLVPGSFGRKPPMRVRVFHDGLWITEAKGAAASLLGARLTKVGALTDIALMRKVAETWAGAATWAHRWSPVTLGSAGWLEGLGAVAPGASSVRVEAVTQGDRRLVADLPLTPDGDLGRVKVQARPTPREGWAAAEKVGNYVRALPDHAAVYASIDDMDDVEGRTFPDLARQLFAAIAAPTVQRVVIDLRRNGGGDNYKGEALRKGLGRTRFNRPGGLYVLTSPATFSAAQNLANRLERETYALFVGEPTGLSPNHYGDAAVFQGPATGVTAIVSTIPWFDSYPQDKRSWIMPDIPVPALFADWAAGRDPALDAALAHRTQAPPDDFAADRVFYYARDSQKVAWAPFWRNTSA